MELLPFSPDRCVFLELGDTTALQKLEVSVGDLSPQFDRATYMYYVLIREDQLGKERVVEITATPSTSGAKLYVGGRGLHSSTSQSNHSRLGQGTVYVQFVTSYEPFTLLHAAETTRRIAQRFYVLS